MKTKIISLPTKQTRMGSIYKKIWDNKIKVFLSIFLLSASPIIYQKLKLNNTVDPRISIESIIPKKVIDSEEGTIEIDDYANASIICEDEVLYLTYPYIYELITLSHKLESKLFPLKDLEIYKNKVIEIKTIFNELERECRKLIEKHPSILEENILIDHKKEFAFYICPTDKMPITKIVNEISKKNEDFFLQLIENYDKQKSINIEKVRNTNIHYDLLKLSNYGKILKFLEEKKYFTNDIINHETKAEQTRIRINNNISNIQYVILIFALVIFLRVIFRDLSQKNEEQKEKQLKLQLTKDELITKKEKEQIKLINLEIEISTIKIQIATAPKYREELKKQLKEEEKEYEQVKIHIKAIDNELKEIDKSTNKELTLLLNPNTIDKKMIEEILKPLADLFKDQKNVYITEQEIYDDLSLQYMTLFFDMLRNNRVEKIKLILGIPKDECFAKLSKDKNLTGFIQRFPNKYSYNKNTGKFTVKGEMNDEERNNLKIVFSGSDDQKKINKMMTWSQEFKNKRAIFDKMITALREEKNLEIDIVDSKWIHDRIIESNEGEAQLDRSLAQMHHVNSESLLSCGVYFSTKYIKEKKEYREKSKYLEEILKHTQSLDNWEKVYKKKDNK